MHIITCHVCTESYPLYLFEFGIPYWCRCGSIVGPPTEDAAVSEPRRVEERELDPSPTTRSGRPTSEPSDRHAIDPSNPSGIELSASEWQDLQAELEARNAGLLPEFDWPYAYDLRFSWELDDERKTKELQRRADRICYLISATSYSRQDIDHEKRQLRERCERYFPEIERAYEKIYERRFEKLWSQFRDE